MPDPQKIPTDKERKVLWEITLEEQTAAQIGKLVNHTTKYCLEALNSLYAKGYVDRIRYDENNTFTWRLFTCE